MRIRFLAILPAALLATTLLTTRAQAALTPDQQATIDKLTGAKGTYTAEEDTHRVTFPRNDLKPTIEGRAYGPFMGFTSWAAFTSAGANEVMVMGDFVLTEDEVNPVMSVALEGGLEVTALHNHFFFVEPRVMFMHIGGHGGVDKLAPVVQQMAARITEIRANAAPAAKFSGSSVPETNAISGPPLEAIFGGVKGEANNGMFKVTIGRKATMHGATVSKQMGVNTWAAFAGSDNAASVDGDFVVTAAELQPVLRSLRKSGINIVAIHSHMTEEQPRYIFLHYWGKGAAAELAKSVRAALDLTGK
jgi:hypothetical protein